MRKELLYVEASRGQESITVVTADKGLLRELVHVRQRVDSWLELVCDLILVDL